MNSQDPAQVCYSYLDVETTGLDPASGDRVCEIAVLQTIDGRVTDDFVTLINPGRAIPESAVSIHGISGEMVRSAPFFRGIAANLLNFLEDTVIVAHNAPFDLGFLNMELGNLRMALPELNVIDTLAIARRYYKFQNNNLGQIARSIGLPANGEHRALADVETTKNVFEFFLMDLDRRGIRLKKLKDILKLQGKGVQTPTSKELVLPPQIEDALRVKGKLQIRYLSAYNDDTTTRVIEPFEISVSKMNTYVHAFCHLRKKRCTFRLDRILDIKTL